MAYGIANHNGEEVEVAFSATGVVTDYGVDRSPTWIEWDNVAINDLQEAIYALADDLEFEQEDPDYD